MSFLRTNDPEIAKIIKNANELSQPRPLPHLESCSRCGEIGHLSSSCPNQVPTIDQMQSEIEERISKAIQLAPDSWKDDEFGLYLPSNQNVINNSKSWKDGEFCFNCGEFGHNCDNCKKPNYSKLLNTFGVTLEQKGSRAFLEKRHIIDNIKGMVERCEMKEMEIEQKEDETKDKVTKSSWS